MYCPQWTSMRLNSRRADASACRLGCEQAVSAAARPSAAKQAVALKGLNGAATVESSSPLLVGFMFFFIEAFTMSISLLARICRDTGDTSARTKRSLLPGTGAFERIAQVDWHGLLPYQDVSSEVRNGTH